MNKKQYIRDYYIKHKEYFKKRHAEWYLKNRERLIAKNAEYVKQNKDKINARRRSRSYNPRKDNPLKIKARDRVHYALGSGKLKRKPCLICGKERSQAHHEDYTKPLEVIWLCQRHHTDLHKGILKLP